MLVLPDPFRSDPALWTALVEDSGVAFKMLTADGVMLYANAAYAELVGAPSAESLIGQRPESYLPPEFAREVLALFHTVAASGKPAMLRTMWRGRPVTGIVRPLAGAGAVACTIRPQLPSDSRLRGRVKFIQSKYADEGPIASLSVRERAVLSLIGAGMSIAQIATTLGRSAKTIENQRNSLGRKLKVSNRVELARIALDSGLTRPTTVHITRRRLSRRAAGA